MKIAYVCSNYLPFIGGIETYARQVSQHFSGRHEVVLAAMNFQKNRNRRWHRLDPLSDNLLVSSTGNRRDGAVRIHSLTPSPAARMLMAPLILRSAPLWQRHTYHLLRRATHPFYLWAVGAKMRSALQGSDVVHALTNGDLAWAASRVARGMGIPFVCTPFVHPGQWGDGPNDVVCYRLADAVIGLVESDRLYLERLGVARERLHVVGVSPDLPPSTDGARFRAKHGLLGYPVVLYIGRLMPKKGAPALVGAAEAVWRRFPDVRFVFIGPGSPSEQAVFDRRDERIRYLGPVDAQTKGDALAACDIFCMPSVSEILPTVYLEAWSLGKVVIGGTAPGLRELIEGNGAGRIAGQVPAELAGILVQLLSAPSLRQTYGEAGRALVERHYLVAAVTAKLEHIYRSLCTARQRQITQAI